MELTDKEYQALLTLFHEYHAAFTYLPDYIKQAFQKRLREIVKGQSVNIASAKGCWKEARKWQALYEETGDWAYYDAWHKAIDDVAFFINEAIEKM